AELFAAGRERQLAALEQLKHLDDEAVTTALVRFLRFHAGDPVVKTLALAVLKARGERGVVQMEKFGRSWSVDIAAAPVAWDDLDERDRAVYARLSHHGYHEDPAFVRFAYTCGWSTAWPCFRSHRRAASQRYGPRRCT
ncbi:hypothetical protein, partial [Calditerricola satsumensis]|uniref:hypothetical protein n=1 Tax=Calditerricola satsumensis TaxID=373054 RepID=UPI0006D1290F